MADHDGELLGEALPSNQPRGGYFIDHPGELLQSPVLFENQARFSYYISHGGELTSQVLLDGQPRAQFYISHSGEQLSLGSGGAPVPPQIGDRSFPTAYRPFNIGLDLP